MSEFNASKYTKNSDSPNIINMNNHNNHNNHNNNLDADGWLMVKPKRKIIVKGKKNNSNNVNNNNNNNTDSYQPVINLINDQDNDMNVVTSINTVEKIKIVHDVDTNQIQNQNIPDEDQKGSHLVFNHKWKVYVHEAESDNWTINSFDDDFFTIESVSTALQFFEHMHKFNTKMYNFFIMKSNDDVFIEPIWEHEQNRNGGICSIRIDSLHSIELLQQLLILTFNESLINGDNNIINGISFGSKTNWALIKIWTNNKVDDISKLLPQSIINSYPNINIRYKQNIPEY